jgi:hypothetical protein
MVGKYRICFERATDSLKTSEVSLDHVCCFSHLVEAQKSITLTIIIVIIIIIIIIIIISAKSRFQATEFPIITGASATGKSSSGTKESSTGTGV